MFSEYSSPFGFRSGRKIARKGVAAKPPEQTGTMDQPAPYAPGCPLEERADTLAALDKMHAERPLRPPGRR